MSYFCNKLVIDTCFQASFLFFAARHLVHETYVWGGIPLYAKLTVDKQSIPTWHVG